MAQPEVPLIEGQVLAVADNDIIRISQVDLYVDWVNFIAKVASADGVVTVGPTAAGPVQLPSMFPPNPPLVPNVGYKARYNLKNIYMKSTRAGDGVTYVASRPFSDPS